MRSSKELAHDGTPVTLFLHQEIADYQRIHPGAKKRPHGVGRRTNNWLAS
jgi:hypothetical protein